MEKFNELQTLLLRTAKLDAPALEALTVCALGIDGETGEVVDLIKKFFYHHRPFDREKLIEEAGDCIWYISWAAWALDTSLADLVKWAHVPNPLTYGLAEKELYTRIALKLGPIAGRISHLTTVALDYQVGGLSGVSLTIQGLLAYLLTWLNELAGALNTTLEEMARRNITKLEKRFPAGFNTADSIARKDETGAANV
jgi:NTP pyrophosphatase (non-canonical NTP hydrolase)